MQLYRIVRGLLTSKGSCPSRGKNSGRTCSASRISSAVIAVLASPTQPVLAHRFDVACVLRRNGLLPGDGNEGFEPEVRLTGQQAKDQRNCAPTESDNPLIGRVSGHAPR